MSAHMANFSYLAHKLKKAEMKSGIHYTIPFVYVFW